MYDTSPITHNFDAYNTLSQILKALGLQKDLLKVSNLCVFT